MSPSPNKADDPGYAAANAELTQILRDIENGDIDLDVLAEKVERAAALLQYCRQKLAATETKVQKVTAGLRAAAEAAGGEAAAGGEFAASSGDGADE